jgi:hypothetical protein
MESVKSIVKQYAILKRSYLISLPDGFVKSFSEGDDFLLGGKFGYQYDLVSRGVIVPIADGEAHLIPEDNFTFEEETEVISITRTRVSTSPP